MNGDDPQEKLVWHGTSSLNPGVIFNVLDDNKKILSINLSGTKRSNLTVVVGDCHMVILCCGAMPLLIFHNSDMIDSPPILFLSVVCHPLRLAVVCQKNVSYLLFFLFMGENPIFLFHWM
jgi:hypothetical protein